MWIGYEHFSYISITLRHMRNFIFTSCFNQNQTKKKVKKKNREIDLIWLCNLLTAHIEQNNPNIVSYTIYIYNRNIVYCWCAFQWFVCASTFTMPKNRFRYTIMTIDLIFTFRLFRNSNTWTTVLAIPLVWWKNTSNMKPV